MGRAAGSRPTLSRLLVGTAALLLLSTLGACTSVTSGVGTPHPPGSGTQVAPGAVSIPTGNLTAFDRCMLDAGYQIKAFSSSGRRPSDLVVLRPEANGP
jgi:hypothetical protein